MSEKALGMLKHMRIQIFEHPAPYVVVRGAAVSIGVNPSGSECDGLVDELLQAGYIRTYPSPSLTAHGLYRLTALGISAADEADSPGPGGVGCWEGSVDEKSLQLLKVMREQLGETSASRTVDAVAAASSLGMYPGTLDRSLLYLVSLPRLHGLSAFKPQRLLSF